MKFISINNLYKLKEIEKNFCNLLTNPSDPPILPPLISIIKFLFIMHVDTQEIHNSSLNIAGLVKILKKHDKLSGALVRMPFIKKVLNEPFYRTDVLNNLVKKCEIMLGHIFSMNEQLSLYQSVSPNMKDEEEDYSSIEHKETSSIITVPEELVDIKNMENTYMRLTLSALTVLKEIRSSSSTVNMFSLPPMQ